VTASKTAPSAPASWRAVSWKLVAGMILAGAIAWFAPFDLAFGAATLGSPALRAAAIIALALIGIVVGRGIGLGVEPRALKRPISLPLAVAAAVAVACWAADWAFRAEVPASYTALMTRVPLGLRITLFMLRAFNENIMYRLFLGSILVRLIGLAWRSRAGQPAAGAFWLGFALSQMANVWINVTSLAPVTPLAVLHDTVRYVAPGMVWSWLYWRHGFQSNEIACTTVHLFFQPLVSLRLA
jgi:hypothetical protein